MNLQFLMLVGAILPVSRADEDRWAYDQHLDPLEGAAPTKSTTSPPAGQPDNPDAAVPPTMNTKGGFEGLSVAQVQAKLEDMRKKLGLTPEDPNDPLSKPISKVGVIPKAVQVELFERDPQLSDFYHELTFNDVAQFAKTGLPLYYGDIRGIERWFTMLHAHSLRTSRKVRKFRAEWEEHYALLNEGAKAFLREIAGTAMGLVEERQISFGLWLGKLQLTFAAQQAYILSSLELHVPSIHRLFSDPTLPFIVRDMLHTVWLHRPNKPHFDLGPEFEKVMKD
ncbi:unnamed protein product, partial [Mesorhabditis spiculigera]